jgi:hypothetical protein
MKIVTTQIPLFLALPLIIVSCLGAHRKNRIPNDKTNPETVGVAYLAEDGALEVTLRATGEEGGEPIVGDAQFAFQRGTLDFEKFVKLVGGIKKGETKPIPAMPDSGYP